MEEFFEYSYVDTYLVSHILGHPWEVLGAVSWIVVAIGAAWAVFSAKIQDNVFERIALSTISIAAASRGMYLLDRGEAPLDAVLAPAALAFYVIVIFCKHRCKKWNAGRRSSDQEQKR